MTRDVESIHAVLRRLSRKFEHSDSLLNQAKQVSREELKTVVTQTKGLYIF